ncbi:hypothetical protein ACKWTF_002134 [Chironomus riparius]
MVSNIYEINFTDIYFDPQKKSKRILSCEDAIAEIGFGKVQILVLFAAFLILANTLAETMGISFVIPAAVCDLNLTTSDKGLLSGMTFLGVMSSSHLFGFLADTKGRRVVVLWTLLGSTISTFLSVFMKDFTIFLILRFFSGFCVAGYSAIMYAYLGEFSINKYRASILSWVTTAVGFSSTVMPLLAYWIMSYEWRIELYEGYQFRPWRLLILLYSIFGIAGGILLLFLKESPKYLLSVRKDEEALEVIKWIYRTNTGKSDDNDFNVHKLESEASEIVMRNETGMKAFLMSVYDQTWTLFKPPHAKYFLTCCCLHLGIFAVSGGIALFMPDILNKLAIARKTLGYDNIHVCDIYDIPKEIFLNSNETLMEQSVCIDNVDLNIYVQSVFVGIGYLIGFVVLSIIINPYNRTHILVFNYTVAAISGIVLTFLTSSSAIVACFTIFVFFTGVNVPVVNSAAVDIFPTFLRYFLNVNNRLK